MGLSVPSNPIVPGGGQLPLIPPAQPQKTHAWSNITKKATGLFSGVKEKWNSNTPSEKRYLIIAAAVLAIILAIFSLIGVFGGFGAALQILPSLLPLTFGATWPMFMYGRSKQKRRDATPKEIAAQKKLAKQIAQTTKANWIYNKKIRQQRAARLANLSQSSVSTA